MERLGHFLLAVWREACRHTDIGAALAESAPELFARLPVDLVLVRRFDANRRSVDTVGRGLGSGDSDQLLPQRSDLSAEDYDRLLDWCGRHELVYGDAAAVAMPPGLLPQGLTGQILAGPLNAPHGPVGLLLLVSRSSLLKLRHQRVLRLLLEPFTVWLENDRRLREAVEADNRALCKRDELVPLDTAMIRHIEAALAQCHGRIEGPAGAARLLDINPHTLRGRMRSLGIDWHRFRQRQIE
jgi:hypothetical protein